MENLLLCLPAHFLDGGEWRRIGLEEGDAPEKERESTRRNKEEGDAPEQEIESTRLGPP